MVRRRGGDVRAQESSASTLSEAICYLVANHQTHGQERVAPETKISSLRGFASNYGHLA